MPSDFPAFPELGSAAEARHRRPRRRWRFQVKEMAGN